MLDDAKGEVIRAMINKTPHITLRNKPHTHPLNTGDENRDRKGRQFLSHAAGFELTTVVVIVTDCIGICKYEHHTITTREQLKDIVRTCNSHLG